MAKKKKKRSRKKELHPVRLDPVKEFLKLLDSNKRLGWYEVFRLTIDLMFYGVTRNDEEYLKIVPKLGEDYVRAVPKWIGTVIYHWQLDQQAQDVLGMAYQQWGAADKKHFAQYFTPMPVAQMMAKMTLGDIKSEQFEKPEGLTLGEPAVGSGVMILAALNEILAQHGYWGVSRTRVTGIDVDRLMCEIAAIQCFFFAWAIAPVGEILILRGSSLGDPKELVPVAHWLHDNFMDQPPPTGLEQMQMF